MAEKRGDLSFAIDGMVMTFTDPDYQTTLGRSKRTNNYQLALKLLRGIGGNILGRHHEVGQPRDLDGLLIVTAGLGIIEPLALDGAICKSFREYDDAQRDYVDDAIYDRVITKYRAYGYDEPTGFTPGSKAKTKIKYVEERIDQVIDLLIAALLHGFLVLSIADLVDGVVQHLDGTLRDFRNSGGGTQHHDARDYADEGSPGRRGRLCTLSHRVREEAAG